MQAVMDMIRAIRNLRAEMKVSVGKRTRLMLLAKEGWQAGLSHAEPYFKRLAGASQVELITDAAQLTEKTVSAVTDAGTVYIPLGDLVDIDKEIARLEKEQKALEGEIARAEGKLSNPGFTGKAPAALVEQERQKLAANREKLEALRQRIAELQAM